MENKIKEEFGSLRAGVYQLILDKIMDGTYDTRSIITEKELIATFKVSKSPVRDALIELCNEGILESLPRTGYRLVQYSTNYLNGILRFRMIVEPKYLKEGWDKITPLDKLRINNANDIFLKSQNVNKPLEYWKLNIDFHLTIACATHDEFYCKTLSQALKLQLLVFAQYYHNHWDKTIFTDYTNHHIALVEAINNGDRDFAVELLERDIQTFTKY